MIKQNLEEWQRQGQALFGKNKRDWVFVCPRCKTKQTFSDFEKLTKLNLEQINCQIAFSCIGRNTKEKGCDWTLGGFLLCHRKLIKYSDGKEHPAFLFEGEEDEK